MVPILGRGDRREKRTWKNPEVTAGSVTAYFKYGKKKKNVRTFMGNGIQGFS